MLHPVITKETIEFLNDLKKNNNREWFTGHKNRFTERQKEVKTFMEYILEMMKSHDEIEKLKMFRIYRDIRFSKDKTPYKHNFSGSFSRSGLDRRGGYYVHIEPGGSFIATGFWNPEKDDLLRIRKEWELDTTELKGIIENKGFKEIWGELVGDELKTAPKGFDKDDPNIDLIKKKQFIFIRKFTDTEVLQQYFADTILESFRRIRPYFDLMSSILTTNLNGESLLD
ncbi:DUF2461 domain-containing protein [Maribacter sp. CXY002]|uniref:DUF2461 domain-containing protein n=1 Tax=Maribacter luteocoastalis TaxID=3407671 RepID=UPI003B6783ED